MRLRTKFLRFVASSCLSALTFLAPWALLKDEFTNFWHRQGCALVTNATRDYSVAGEILTSLKLCTPAPPASSKSTPQKPKSSSVPYQRSFFGPGWEHSGNGCLNTRAEVLRSTSTIRVRMSKSGCTVERGRWLDPYTNRVYLEARDLDIDHLVPLSFAWAHGANQWSAEKRAQFANDMRNLFAVQNSGNRSKSDKSPLDWLPPNRKFQCEYTLRYSRIMKIYGLQWSAVEASRYARLQGRLCPSLSTLRGAG